MRRLSIIGIGAGNPDYITLQAIKALETVDAVFLIDKGEEKDDLAKLRREICERYIKKAYRLAGARAAARDRTPEKYGGAARHRIALNRIGGPVHITTGRQLAKGMPGDDVVVMLDGECAFKTVKESNVDIYWGAYVG